MPIGQNFLIRRNHLVGVTLLTCLFLPCYRAFGATISFGFSKDFFAELATEAEIFLEGNEMAWDAIAGGIEASVEKLDAIELAIADMSSNSQERNNKNSNLSIGMLVDAFGQLKRPGASSQSVSSDVSILPQVGYADTNKGVYAFDATTAPRNRSTSSVIFSLNPIYAMTVARSNANRVGNNGVISLNGSRSSSVASSLLAGPQLIGKPSSSSTHNATFSQAPGHELALMLDRIDTNLPIAGIVGANNSFGLMAVDELQLLPERPIPTPVQLKNDFTQANKLVRNDLQFTSPLQSQVQQQIRQQSQQRYEQQQEREQRYREKWQEKQQRQQEKAREKLAKQQERQQRQLQKQIERQQKLQAAYQRQMQR